MNDQKTENSRELTPEEKLQIEKRKENLKTASRILRTTIEDLEKTYDVKFTLVDFSMGFVSKEESTHGGSQPNLAPDDGRSSSTGPGLSQ